MIVLNPSVTELKQGNEGIKSILQQIEIGGRICYKSEDKITSDSCVKFVNMLIKRGHLCPLEHGTVYLICNSNRAICKFYENNKYSRIVYDNSLAYITTNYRVIVENDRLGDLEYLVNEPSSLHFLRKSYIFTCDRGVSHELVRHRTMSFNQESTRYVNYSQDKWGNEISVIKPPFWKENEPNYYAWYNACLEAEGNYMMLIRQGALPQEARNVLPTSVKTEILVTGFVNGEDGWEHLLKLRCDKAAHPQIRELCNIVEKELKPIITEQNKLYSYINK